LNIREKRKIKNLTYHLIKKGRISTSVPFAKKVRSKAEKLITRAKKDTVSNRKYAARFLPKDAIMRLFTVIGPANLSRNGGYTRLLRLDEKVRGDGSEKCIIEIINA
jgi:large subunit ribosomal protein L17